MGGCGSKAADTAAVPTEEQIRHVETKQESADISPVNMNEMPFSPTHMPFSPTYNNQQVAGNPTDAPERTHTVKQFSFDSPDASVRQTDQSGTTSRTTAEAFDAPPILQSFINKQGHRVKNWKSRYFVLSEGILRYFELPDSSPPFGTNLKGELKHLELYTISEDEADIPADMWKNCDHDAFHLYLIPSTDGISQGAVVPPAAAVPNLLLQFDNAQRMTTWFAALKSHIAYKRQLVTNTTPS